MENTELSLLPWSCNFVTAVAASRSEDTLDMLPQDLQEVVAADNKTFAHEIEDWDIEQTRKSANDTDVTVIPEQRSSKSIEICL